MGRGLEGRLQKATEDTGGFSECVLGGDTPSQPQGRGRRLCPQHRKEKTGTLEDNVYVQIVKEETPKEDVELWKGQSVLGCV